MKQTSAQTAVPTWSGAVSSRWASTLRRTAGPLVLTVTSPLLVVVAWSTCAHLGGSIVKLATVEGIATVWRNLPVPSLSAAAIIIGFVLAEAILLHTLPGKAIRGPLTPMGDRPRYRHNGIIAWVLTHAAFLGASYGFGWFSPGVLYGRFGELLQILNH